MKSSLSAFFAAVLCLVGVALAKEQVTDTTSATDVSNPIYKSLRFPKGAEIVHIKPIGEDTVLEEGAAHEVELKPQGEETLIADQKPVTHTLDTIHLPDSEIEASSVKLSDVKTEAKPAEVSSKTFHKPTCPSTCTLTRHICPYGCKASYCILVVKQAFRKKYLVRVKYIVKLRRYVLVKVKVCKKVQYYTHYGYRTKCLYIYKPVYKWVVYYKTKYRYETRYKTVFKYKYSKGLRCMSTGHLW